VCTFSGSIPAACENWTIAVQNAEVIVSSDLPQGKTLPDLLQRVIVDRSVREH
jgi:hypothetical protein